MTVPPEHPGSEPDPRRDLPDLEDPAATRPMKTDRLPRLGHFAIEEKIGEGGMGIVYRAYDPDLQRHVAIKKIHPRVGNDPELAERFLTEARSIAAVSHPNIAQIHSIHGHEGETAFFVMEFVDGDSIERRVERRGPLPVPEAVEIVIQAARGLRAASRQGIVHRDVKPSNLVVTRRGVVKLVDFGLSRPVHDTLRLTDCGVILGTPHYVSPEQSRGWSVDHRSDIYSLGCTFYFLLTGQPPFEGTSKVDVFVAHANEPIPSASALRAEVPASVDRILSRMLAKRPEDRYDDYDELIAELCIIFGEPSSSRSGWDFARLLRAATWTLLVACTLTLAAIVLLGTSPWFRRTVGFAEREQVLNPESFFADIYTPATANSYERLEYRFARDLPHLPGIRTPNRTEARANRHPPDVIDDCYAWMNHPEPVFFPFLKEFRELELTALRFEGTPDFELKVGFDDEQGVDYLRISFRVGEKNHRVVDYAWLGEMEDVETDQQPIDFTIEEGIDYTLRLVRKDTGPGTIARFTLKILRILPGDQVTILDLDFTLPRKALSAGYLVLACEEDPERQPWAVQVREVLIKGRLDHRRIARDMKGGSRP